MSFFREVLSRPSPGTLLSLVRESFTIGGWVALGRPMEIDLYDWWPLWRLGRIYEKPSLIKVDVRETPRPLRSVRSDRRSMGEPLIRFRERLPLGFGSKRQGDETEKIDRAHGDPRIPQGQRGIGRRGGIFKNYAGQQTEQGGSAGGYKPAHIIAKTCSRTPQPSGEQFREIDCIPPKNRKRPKTHDGDQQENAPEIVQEPKCGGHAEHGDDKGHGEGGFAARPLS